MNLGLIALNHIALHVEDVPRSVDFYKNKLGLEMKPRPDFDFPGAWFRLGENQELHLIGDRVGVVLAGKRSNHFALEVASIETAEQFLQSQQVTYFPPKARPDGVVQLFLQDPDGYYVELFAR